MREANRQEVAASNERALSTLARAINLSQGNFALILVRCNYEVCKEQMWQRLQALTGTPLLELVLPKSITTLFTTILSATSPEQTCALSVFGLESVTALDRVLLSTNQVRDEFRKTLTAPLVLWVTDEVLQKLTRFAPDFKSWAATSIKFELATDHLLGLWHQTADELFAAVLGSDAGEFVPNKSLNLAPGCRRRQELESALRDLNTRNVSLEPALIATWQFLLGRDAFSLDQIDVALHQYQQSLKFWQQELGIRDWLYCGNNPDDMGISKNGNMGESGLCPTTLGVWDATASQELPRHYPPAPQTVAAGANGNRVELSAPNLVNADACSGLNSSDWLCQPLACALPLLPTDASKLCPASFWGADSVLPSTTSLRLTSLSLRVTLTLSLLLQRRLPYPYSFGERWCANTPQSSKAHRNTYSSKTASCYSSAPLTPNSDRYRVAGEQTTQGFVSSTPPFTSATEASPSLPISSLLSGPQPLAFCAYIERVGILLQHIGLCYCRKAQLQRSAGYSHWEQARESFNASIEVFAVAGRFDLVAQLTIQLGEVLLHLEKWTDLQALALQSLEQPQTQNNPVQLAQAYGFLAAVALAQSEWEDAKALAITALDILEQFHSPEFRYRGWFLLLLAKARRQLGELKTAVTDLEQAIKLENSQAYSAVSQASLQQHPQLYIDILQELRSLYFEQQQYLRAFELKQEQRSIQQQYGLCTFLGASPLPSLRPGRGIQYSTPEIEVAGRQPDVNRLLERLSRNDHKLTIIHGASGVGKSSLINAGLVPALEARTIGAREAIPVVQKVYRDWIGELARCLTQSLANWNTRRLDSSNAESKPSALPYPFGKGNASRLEIFPPYNLQTILEQLRLSAERNLLTVLIFDQFEEFFFVCTDLNERRQFYDFLAKALDLPFVKVILSLREDYLHFLLECERHNTLNTINNNILDRQLRYHLGDLSPEDAKKVICTLVCRSQFQLEESLIDVVVKDLAGNAGAVRLIELQVVGAQLQAEKITKLGQYYALGIDPKASLVERSLLNVIEDCGAQNEDTVWQILFSLTNDKGTRPLKTKAELGMGNGKGETQIPWMELGVMENGIESDAWQMPTSQDQIDLILKILVGSGLVFRVPDELQDRYQLVHDYLVEPIRQKYQQRTQSNIVAQLEKSEMALLRVRKQRWRALAVGVTMAVLAVTAAGLGWRAEVQRRLAATLLENAQLSTMSVSSEALFVSNKQFDALLQALRAARRLKELDTFKLPSLGVEPDTRLQVLTAMSQAVYGTSERNRLEGHSDVIWNVSFSPDGQLIASASRDQTVQLWRPNGTLVTTLNGHEDSVTSVSFSPDGQLIASGSWDTTVKLWRRDGTFVRTLQGYGTHVYGVSFSPNGQIIASGSGDGSIRLWTVDGQLIRTFPGHEGMVTWVSFSPDGQVIASASADKTIKLWTLEGKLLRTLKKHGGKVNCVVFSPDGKTLASASDDRTVMLWNRTGELIKTFPKHDNWVLGVAFSPDGQLIASSSADNNVRLFSRDGTLLKTFTGHSDQVTAVSFSPIGVDDGRLGITDGSPELNVGKLNVEDSRIQPSHLQPSYQSPSITSPAPIPILASASLDKSIKLWGLRDLSRLILQHQDDVRDVTFSPQGELMATASNDGTVKIWTRKGLLLHTLKGHTDKVYSVSFSPDGQLIASASRDGTVKLWSTSGSLIKTLREHSDWVLDVSFSPDGKRLLGAGRDGTVKLWHRSGTLIKTLTGHQNRVNAVSFSPDGQRIATASDDNTVKLWSADGRLLKTLQGHSNWVLDVNFAPDSQMLASASYDNTVKLWSREGVLLKTLKGHTDSVAHVRFSPTGKILATTSWDNRVQLWRLDDTLIKSWEGHFDRITSVNWSYDGKALATASQDSRVIVWNLDLDELLSNSCNWLRDYLQHNPKVRPSDRELCEAITTQTKTEK